AVGGRLEGAAGAAADWAAGGGAGAIGAGGMLPGGGAMPNLGGGGGAGAVEAGAAAPAGPGLAGAGGMFGGLTGPGAAPPGWTPPDTQGGQAAITGAAPAGRAAVARAVAEEWRAAGMSEAGIAGIMANIQSESRFDPTLRHFDQPRFRGTEAGFAHGLYQEGGDEWNNYSAWLQKNHPGADWRDARLQSRFAAEALRTRYPQTWRAMN